MGHVAELEVGENRFPPRASSEQQRFYGLALSELLSYRGPVHTSVTHWPRLPLTARHSLPTRTWAHYTRQQLDIYWLQLEKQYRIYENNKKVLAGELGANLWLVPGEWCKFCPVKDCLVRKDENG